MAVTEERRHDLYTHFEETMGHERATTLMELLPPVGWGDVATKQDVLLLKQDLTAVDSSLRQEITAVESSLRKAIEPLASREDLANLEVRITDKMNRQLFAVMGINLTFWGLCVGVVTLLR